MPVIQSSEPHELQVEDLNLIRDWDDDAFRPKLGLATVLSICFHVGIFGILLVTPKSVFESNPRSPIDIAKIERKVTPLVAPRFELTQKEPNKGPIKPEVNLDDLNASLQQRRAPKTYVPPPTPAQKAEPAPRPVEAPPQLETAFLTPAT